MALSETRRPRTCIDCGAPFIPSQTALQIDPAVARCLACRRKRSPGRRREMNAQDGLTSVQRDCIERCAVCTPTATLPPCIHGLVMTSTSCKVKYTRGVLLALARIGIDRLERSEAKQERDLAIPTRPGR